MWHNLKLSRCSIVPVRVDVPVAGTTQFLESIVHFREGYNDRFGASQDANPS